MIPQYKPIYSKEEADALHELVMSGSFLSDYEHTRAFEDIIKLKTGAKYCSVVNNGTVAISLALLACAVPKERYVIVPNTTMIASATAVEYAGYSPIVCDVEMSSRCLNISKAIEICEKFSGSSFRKVGAIVYVTLNGRSQDNRLKYLKQYCDKNNIVLIKDDAQSLGALSDSGVSLQRPDYGHVHTLSFSPHKIVSCGQGGAILTDDKVVAENVQRLRDFGRLEGGADIHTHFGINSKFTEMQAVVGICQIKQLEDRVIFKRKLYELYFNSLKDHFTSKFYMLPRNINHVPWFIDIYSDQRDKLSAYLKQRGIGTRNMYPPIHRQPVYSFYYPDSKDTRINFENSIYIGNTGLWLPSSFDLSISDVEKICNAIKQF